MVKILNLSRHSEKILLIVVITLVAIIGFKGRDYENPMNFALEEYSEDENLDNTSQDTEDSMIMVHIEGEVVNPGVYTCEKGDRLIDLVNQAGGFTEQAASKSLNLATRIEDEMMIIVPNLSDGDLDNLVPIAGIISSPQSDGKIDINNASKEELMTLPNIGPKTADSIIEFRQGQKFEKIEDITMVSGIGEKTFESLKDLIYVK